MIDAWGPYCLYPPIWSADSQVIEVTEVYPCLGGSAYALTPPTEAFERMSGTAL